MARIEEAPGRRGSRPWHSVTPGPWGYGELKRGNETRYKDVSDSVFDPAEQPKAFRAVFPFNFERVLHYKVIDAPQLRHRIWVIIHPEVVVAPRVAAGDEKRGRLLSPLVPARSLAGFNRKEQALRQFTPVPG